MQLDGNENYGMYFKAARTFFDDYNILNNYSKGGYEFVTTCPFCNSKDKLYINLDSGITKCWKAKCPYRGGKFPFLISQMKGWSYDKAKDETFKLIDMEDAAASAMDILEARIEKSSEELSEKFDIFVDDAELVPFNSREHLNWLKNIRNPSWGINGSQWFMKKFPIYKSSQPLFNNRALFEIKSNGSRSYLAYSMMPNPSVKTLNPPGAVLSKMLGNYDMCHNEEWLFVCEGFFSAARVMASGYDAVCSFGVNLSPYQAVLLSRCKAKNVVFLYDNGAGPKARRNAEFMQNNFSLSGKNYYFHEIAAKDADPDDLGFKGCKRYIQLLLKENKLGKTYKGFDNVSKDAFK